jgi:hydroxymethylglutaryl-CoA reductase (NADPH)
MSEPMQFVKKYLSQLFSSRSVAELTAQLSPKHGSAAVLPKGSSPALMKQRLAMTGLSEEQAGMLADGHSTDFHDAYVKNIENYVGTVRVPVGLAGPLRVNGLFAQGDYLVPLATTEAALVASYHRGSRAITAAGGCTAMVVGEGVSRSPGFVFASMIEAGTFVAWVNEHFDDFHAQAAATTRHGVLADMKTTIDGNQVFLSFEYLTGNASGQNMVTIATEAVRAFILSECPVKPLRSYVEANLSGDKKASFQSFHSVRGKKVTVEVTLPDRVIKEFFRTTAADMAAYGRISAAGGSLSGTIGLQGHYANSIAALYLACGQDAACVAESAVGLTRMETVEGGLYASVSLPNLMVGTVGGGTGLPTQQACLSILHCPGDNGARAFAEVAAAVCLAGELSITAALTTGEFTRAHQLLARRRGRQKGSS